LPETRISTAPSQLGRYKVLDEIGRGAMGVVYLARDPLIGRLVALKTFRMSAALAGKELTMFRARFIREAQSAGILSHPNIVTIHDVVEESEEGATFIAMEYVRGTDLKERLAGEGRLELADAVHVVTQVAEGLDYAHSKGVVHRDVKPANILLTEDRQVKLTDFGIARLDTSNLTLEGQLLGTPNYMAPEQIQGQATDHRADVFSLGVVLYEMLTGEKPFKGENVTMVTHRIVYDEFTAPEEYLGHLPEPVLEVLARALAKEPDERFPSVREMAQALQEAAAEIRAEERLNETQVIFDPALAELPEPAPPPAGGTALAGLTGGLRAVGSGLTRAGAGFGPRLAAAGRAPLRLLRNAAPGALPLEVPPLSRLALVAVLTIATATLLGGLLVFAAGWAGAGEVGEASPEHRQRAAAVPLLREAHLRLEEGDPLAALVYLREAERTAPDLSRIRVRRRQVEDQARSLFRLEDRVDRVAEGLEAARIAAEERRWEEAREAARTVLALEPENQEAAEIAERAEGALQRIERRREAEARAAEEAAAEADAGEDLVADVDPAPEPQAPGPAEDAAPAGGRATLDLFFFSELPEGVLTLYFGEEQLLRESYRFYRKEGFFRSVASAGKVEGLYEVPSGSATVRVLVALPGRPALSRVLQANFPGGTTRRLNVRVSEDHTLTARLE
jgi:predicted Ser/Thr protein kinase